MRFDGLTSRCTTPRWWAWPSPHAACQRIGTLYVVVVLVAALLWGLGWAIGVSVVSLLAFNFFVLPPVHTFALEDASNWTALLVYLVTATVTSELAARLRRRAAAGVRGASARPLCSPT